MGIGLPPLRAAETGMPVSLPAPARPWLNEPALSAKIGPDFAGLLGRIYRELSTWPADPEVGRMFSSLADPRCEASGRFDAEGKVLEAKRRFMEGDRGLNFEAGTRLDPDVGDPDVAGHYVYAGLSWDYYRDGLWSHRSQAEMLRLERELLSAKQAQSEPRLNLGCRQSRLIANFNVLKLRLMGKREELLRSLHEVYRQAYFLGFVNLDEVMLVERDVERTKHFVAGFQEFNRRLASEGKDFVATLSGEPPLLDLEIASLVAEVRNDPAYLAMAGLEREMVDLRHDDRHDKRLRFYIYPRMKWNDDFRGRADLVAGVTFSMPLADDKDLVRDAERAVPALRQTELQGRDADELARLYHEYQYRLDDAIKLHYQRALVLERLRRAFIETDLPPGPRSSLPEVLQGVRDLLDTQLEILDIKQNLYSRMLHIFAQANRGYRPEFVRVVGEDKGPWRQREGERALYVWSAEFNRFTNPALLHLLKTKAFSGVVLSAGRQTQADKLKAFLALARDAGIRVELMLSDNELFKPGHAAKAAERAEALWALSPHLHLDVEPHALPDFKAKRGEYLRQFQQLLERLGKRRGQGRTLSVALPTLLDEAEVRALSAPADRVYVMAYGSNRAEVIQQRMKPFLGLPEEKKVLVLRPGDFQGELELESTIGNLLRLGVTRQFALHDLAQFQSMIERNP